MTTIITRLYASTEKGAAAVSALKAKKFKDSDFDCITGGEGAAAALAAAGVYEAGAQTYAEKLKGGGAVVVVRAAFGNAVLAKRILDASGPEASPVKYDEVYAGSQDRPNQTKERYLPELLPDGTLVLSDMLFPRAVIKGDWHMFGGSLSSRVPTGGLSDWSFSRMLGLPLLSSREPKVSLITSPPYSSLINK